MSKSSYKATFSHRIKFFFLFIFLLGMVGCQQEKKTITIGFSQLTGEDGWRQSQLKEMKRALSFHSNVKFIYKDAHKNSQRQIRQIKELIKDSIDALIVSPYEATPLTPIVSEVYKKGIPVITVDRKTNSSYYTSYVGASNKEIGFLAGKYVAKILQEKGTVLEIQGLPGSTPAQERHSGFEKALQKYPNIKIVKELYADWTGSVASEKIEANKQEIQNIDLVFAQNDVMAHAAYKVFKLWGRQSKVKFVGVDASPGPNLGISWVADGILNASVLYPTGGKEAINAAINAAGGDSIPKRIQLNTFVIDSSNVRLMKLQTDKILSQQNDIKKQQDLIDKQTHIYKSQKNILFILLGTLIIAILLGVLGFLGFRKNKRITKSLRAKNKEILFQQNKLIELSNKAEEATEAKLNFFTNISHEFRTPLTLIFGTVEELIDNKTYDNNLRRHLKMIQKNANRLYRMVNQLIDYRKIDVKKMKLHASEIDIIYFLEDILSSFKDLARKRSIDLRTSYEKTRIMLWFDPNMMDKVFFNLLSNAFKFTEDYGRIEVNLKVDESEGKVIIEVRDNGHGISAGQEEHIFDPFYQERKKGGPQKGFGLGLPLAKEFVTLHHGRLFVVPKDGPGATFRLSLPIGKEHLQPNEINEQPIPIKERNPTTPKEQLIHVETKKRENNLIKTAEGKNFSILVIEDNKELRQFLSRRLSENFKVSTAKDGDEGLKVTFEIIPDLVISDLIMPNKDGLSYTQMIKSNIRTSHIPVILLTAKGGEEQRIKGMKTMADYYIVKPFKFNFLKAVIDTLIKNRATLREHYSSNTNLDKITTGMGKLDRQFLNELNAFINENMKHSDLNIDKICNHMGVSRVQLYRKTKALLGKSVNELILAKRLSKAKTFLANGDLSISEIAYEVGFSSPSYFSTVFKKQFNQTPSEWQ